MSSRVMIVAEAGSSEARYGVPVTLVVTGSPTVA